MFGWPRRKAAPTAVTVHPDPFPRHTAPAPGRVVLATAPTIQSQWWDGEKFHDGWGATGLLTPDYWMLRARSAELFRRNLDARGLIRRLVTNIINTGLHLEATPLESVIGVPEDALAEWSESVETRFGIWCDRPGLCDYAGKFSFGQLQALIKQEAMVVGDLLVVEHTAEHTGLPRLQLINGGSVQTPLEHAFGRKPDVRHGVEFDKQGRQVAYHVRQEDGTSRRLPAYGPRSGRRVAWLVYGGDKRFDDVRGEPLLSLALQNLKEIDRYRDAALRKAELNAMLAMFIRREQPGIPTTPFTSGGGGGAVRRNTETMVDSTGTERSVKVSEHLPGMVIETLQPGEEPKGFPAQGTDEKFGPFRETMMAAIAAAFEIPPEIYQLAFSHNYSASQAANNEFALYLKRARDDFARQVCQPCYEEWQIGEVLNGKIEAPGLLDAWRDPERYDIYGAWVASDWAGQIKPAADMLKVVRAYEFMVDNGFITRSRAARELSGMKFSTLAKQLRKDNELLAWAREPLGAASGKPGDAAPAEQLPGDDQDDEKDNDEIALAVLTGGKAQ